MKRNQKILIVCILSFALLAHQTGNAQNWDMKGNADAFAGSKIGTTNALPVRIATNNMERMCIDENGKVGIGTMAPLYMLHVAQNGYFGKGLTVTDGGPISEYIGHLKEPMSLLVRGSEHTGIGVEGKKYGIFVKGGQYGVVVDATSMFGVSSGAVEVGILGEGKNGYGVKGYGPTGVYGEGPIQGVWGKSGQIGVHGDGTGVGWGGYFYSEKGSGIYAATGNADKNYAAVFNGNILVNNVLNPSDERLKKNIEPIYNSLDIVKELKPKRFEFKINENDEGSFYMPNGKHYGFIAQEVEQILPNLVKENDLSSYGMMHIKSEEQASYKSVNYIELIPLLTKAIQEQQTVIEKQQENIADLLKRIEILEKKLIIQ